MEWFLKHRAKLIERHYSYLAQPAANPASSASGSGTRADLRPPPSPAIQPVDVTHVAAPQAGVSSLDTRASSMAPSKAVAETPAMVDGRRAVKVEGGSNATAATGTLVATKSEATGGGCRLLSFVTREQLVRILQRMLDESQFLGKYGLRSMSREHEAAPFTFEYNGFSASLKYEPGESSSSMYGGNSSWRGPIWLPTNYMLLERLQLLDHYFGDSLTVEFPTGSGTKLTLWDVSQRLSSRIISLFRRDGDTGLRPVDGGNELFSNDARFAPYHTFYEYFDPETG
jgi:hypothetical protein